MDVLFDYGVLHGCPRAQLATESLLVQSAIWQSKSHIKIAERPEAYDK